MLDINKVCKQYGITSRTLRFYEEKGLIKGQKSPDSGRRQYSEDDLRMLQGILTLRAIGLPIKEIKECLKDGKSLIEILRYREKELEAAIRGKMEEILMLQKALAAVEEGKDVFAPILKLDDAEAEPWERVNPENASQNTATRLASLLDSHVLDYKKAAATCAEYILQKEYEKLSHLFSPKMQAYLPKEVFEASWRDITSGIGAFRRHGKTWEDPSYDNVIYTKLHFEKIAIRVKFVFHGEMIHGLWFEYVENEKGKKHEETHRKSTKKNS